MKCIEWWLLLICSQVINWHHKCRLYELSITHVNAFSASQKNSWSECSLKTKYVNVFILYCCYVDCCCCFLKKYAKKWEEKCATHTMNSFMKQEKNGIFIDERLYNTTSFCNLHSHPNHWWKLISYVHISSIYCSTPANDKWFPSRLNFLYSTATEQSVHITFTPSL